MCDGTPGPVRARLLQLARESLIAAVQRRPAPRLPADPPFTIPAAAFVTLRCDGRLRGCLGDTSGAVPIGEAVRRLARAAALDDPRFPPVAPHELDAIRIEISRLSAFTPASPESVVVGRHGVLLARGSCRGLLLPQVAAEHRCDLPAFLALACQKAGLPDGAAGAADVRLYIFEAEVFEE